MKPTDKPIRRPETMDLLLGRKPKPKASGPNIYRRPLTSTPAEKPLGLAEQKARARWQRPIAAILAGALAENRGLLDRLRRGVYGPDMKRLEQYQVVFNGLYQTTLDQVEALEIFSKIDWSD